MVIGGVNGTNAQAGAIGMNKSNDPVAKNIERQIANIQKQIQELSSNKDMSVEDKMKKRQEMQQEINELNNQLRQHQIEQRREKQEKKESSDDIFDSNSQYKDNKTRANQQNTGFSQAGMEAMISADTSMKQAAVHGSVASKMEGKAGVLEIEIKLDTARNGNVGRKRAELAEVKKRAEEASASQLDVLAKASEVMKDASKEEQSDNSVSNSKDISDNAQAADKNSSTTKADDSEDRNDKTDNNAISGNEDETSRQNIYYTPVDVRL